MKLVDEFRDPQKARELVSEIKKRATRRWVLMELCGGQTHSLIRYGIDQLLTDVVELVHGPGCPVCVTPVEVLDRAIELSQRPEVIFCSFGDMLRVPGTREDLFSARAKGADVRVVYSPMDALDFAIREPAREVIFLAVGFETTAPANAMAVHEARRRGVRNFSLLVSQVLVPPAMEAILSSPKNRVQGFLAAGHVCTVMGYLEYEPLAKRFQVPIVVTGFEPLDLLEGIYLCVNQLEEGRFVVENQYTRSVKREGNLPAQRLVSEVFEVAHRRWRGVGEISSSGLVLSDQYRDWDADQKFPAISSHTLGQGAESSLGVECISGEILQGNLKPSDCPSFGKACTPEFPLGATMVSNEGACSAYWKYRRNELGVER